MNHFTNFFDTMHREAKLNEDRVFGFRAAAPGLACNKSYFERKIINWDPQAMRIKA